MKTKTMTIYRDPCSDLVAYRTVERDASGRVIGEARGDIAHLAHLGEALASADEVDTSGLSVSDVAHDLPVARATIVDLTRITRWMAVDAPDEGGVVLLMTTTTYYRIGSALSARDMHRDHVSRVWCGDEGERERRGMSVVADYDALITYLAEGGRLGRGATYRDAWLSELTGEVSDDEPRDEGELLIHPETVVSQEPASAALAHAVAERLSEAGDEDERVVYVVDVDDMRFEDRCVCGGSGRDDEEEDGICLWCDGAGWVRR